MCGRFNGALLKDSFSSAFRSITSNKLRSVLTMAMIALGIMCLVGIQTAIESLSSSVEDTFNRMGAGRFTLHSSFENTPDERNSQRTVITAKEICDFYTLYSVPSAKAVYVQTHSGAEVRNKRGVRSAPVSDIYAVKGDYLNVKGLSIAEGRWFSEGDDSGYNNVCVIGAGLRESLFGGDSCLGEELIAGNVSLKIVGVFLKKGAMFSAGMDNSVVIPLQCYLNGFPDKTLSYEAAIVPYDDMQYAKDEAIALFRNIRRLVPSDENDFSVDTSSGIDGTLGDMKGALSASALLVGLITILGSVVGLMNILIVAVRERIVEIGTCEALGATSGQIGFQFLLESVLMGQGGCIAGVVLGVAAGNIAALLMKCSAAIPWNWIWISVIICLVVSILAGVIPARRAASANPVESLRHE
ncbi:MAG: ABC transporter permease [Bacteroidales bacterium]|nr:ABC transporter permease [Bacteroidales bacterium]